MKPSLLFFQRITGLRVCVLLMALLMISLTAQAQTTRYVKPTASGNGSGTSWVNASGNLQAMITASASGDQVWVAAGTYKPTTGTNRSVSFVMKNGVAIYGGFVGNETLLNQRPAINPVAGQPSSSTLSGDIGSTSINNNSYHVVNNDQTNIDGTAVLDGFVITAGNANGSSNNRAGGGMLNVSASPTVRNCSFRGNTANGDGGGMYNFSANPHLTNCSFQANTTTGSGGGMYNDGSSIILTNCSFQGNTASINGGGIANFNNSSPSLTNCIFQANTATIDGGGMYNYSTNPILTNCLFQVNTGYEGAGLFNTNNSNARLTNCSFQANTADAYGGGLFNNPTSTANLTNCSFQANTATYSGGAVYTENECALTNCVLFVNGGTNTLSTSGSGTVTLRYSLIEASATGFTDGGNNLTTTVSPFVSTTSTQLKDCAPAINAGLSSASGLSGVTTDLAGNPRRYNDGVIDMGAYEYQGVPSTLTLTNPSITNATVGAAFSQSFTASGGTSSRSFSLASGSLPASLSLTAGGMLNGTPTQTGSYSITVRATDANGCSGVSATYTLVINNATPTITGFTTLANTVCMGSPITFTATIGNISGNYGWSLSNGGPPVGSPGPTTVTSLSVVQTANGTGVQTFTLTVTSGGQSVTATTSVTITNSPDYQPLVNLYNATGGANWTNKTGWLSGCDPCTGNGGQPWFGLTCANGRVSRISLFNNNLVGSLPASIGAMTGLTGIQINGNSQLSGSIPTGLGNLTALTSIEMDHNALTGSIPNLSTLTNLQRCFLNTNALTGSIPTSLSALTSLVILDLSSNQLSGSLPPKFNTGLQRLILDNNTLSGNIPASLSALTSLQQLSLSSNQLTGSLPASLSALTSLQQLDLSNNQLTGSLPDNLNRLTSLLRLNLQFNQLSGSLPASLSALTYLQTLNLGNNQFSGCFPTSLTAICGITYYFGGNPGLPGGGNFEAFCNDGTGSEAFIPIASAIPASICVGQQISLNANGQAGMSYSWSAPAGTSLSRDSERLVFATMNTTGVKTFTLVTSIGSNCNRTATVDVTVNSLPSAGLTNNGPLSCTNTSVTLTATGGSSYTFVNSSGEELAGSGNTRTVSSPGTYSVRVANASGCVSTTSTTVISNTAVVTVSNPATTTGTQGAAFSQSFMASGGVSPRSFSLSSGSLPAGLSLSAAGVLSGTPTESGSFPLAVRATDTNGCSGESATYALVITNATPTLTGFAASPNAVCVGSPITFTATVGNVSPPYAFTLSNGTSSTMGNAGSTAFSQMLVASGSNAQTFTLTVSDGGPSATATTSVTVNAQPSAPTSVSVTPASVCGSGQVTLSASGCAGILSWFDASNNSPVSSIPTVLANKSFYAKCTVNGCSSVASANVNVGVITPLATSPGNMDIDWTGAVSTEWNNPCNWSPAWVPDATNSGVVINSRTNQPTITGAVPAVKLIYINDNVRLTVNSSGALTVNGSGGASIILQGTGVSIVNDGTISTSIGGFGFIINGTASSTITNRGLIDTDNSIGVVSQNSANLTVNNEASGTINASFNARQSAVINLTNHGTINYGGGTFALGLNSVSRVVNDGTFNVTAGSGISNPGGSTITNSACGKILMSAGEYQNGGTTTNAGLIQLSNDYDFTNTGTFTNNGVVKANTVSRITNNKMVITNACPIFTLGGSNNYTVSGIFSNSAATVSAGTYTSAGNKFTANNTIPSGKQTLYANVTAGFCTFTVPFDFDNTTPTSVSATSTTVCAGNSTNLTGTCPTGTLTWYTAASGGTSIGTGTNFARSPATTTTYYAACEATNCVSGRVPNVITVNALPTASLTNNGPLSCTLSSVTLTATGGDSYTFTSPGGGVLTGTGNTLAVSTPGSYSVRVGDVNGCVSSTSTSVSSNTAVVTVNDPAGNSVNINQPFSQTFTATGGVSPYSYSLSSGSLPTGLNLASTGVLSGTPTQGGSFTIVVRGTDANGCFDLSSPYALTVNATPTIVGFTTLDNTVCVGSPITFTATVSNVSPPYAYTLSNGTSSTMGNAGSTAFSQNLVASGSNSQSFTLTVGDNGFTASAVTSVTVNALPTAGLTNNGPLTCVMTSVTLTASGGSSYTFTNPGGGVLAGTGSTRVVSSPGSYSVTVASPAGCVSSTSTSVSSSTAAPVASLVSSGSLNCSVTSVTLTASPSGQSSYLFSGPGVVSQSGNTAVVNASGTYSVTVVNGNGCSSVASMSVSQDNSAPTATLISSGSLTCSVTSVTLTASPAGLNYMFSGPGVVSQGNTAIVNASGTYSVTVVNSNGCSSVASTSVSQDNSAPTASLVSSGSLTCSVTSVTLTASPGGLNYMFSGPGMVSQNGNTALVNASGTYSVTVLSANGCSSVASTSVSQDNSAPTASLVSSGSLTCSVTSVTLTASPAGLNYTFSGPGVVSRSGNTALVNASGTYSVTVVSSNGCSSVASVSVSQDNSAPTASLVSSGSLTCSVTSVTLTASPGGLNYTFSGPGVVSQNGNTAIVNASGTYSVTVLSANGCSSVASVSVSQDNSAPTASLVSSGSLTCSVTSVTLTASPGGLNYTFSGPGVVSQNGNTALVNASGTYSVTVVNGNDCSSVASTSVSQDNSAPTASLVSSGSLTCSVTSVTLTASPSGLSYAFSGPGIISRSGNTALVNASGTYSVTVVSSNGCSSVASVSVSQDNSAPVASLISSGSLTCSATSVTLTASPGGLNYTFSGPGVVSQNGNTALVNASGTYSVTVVSSNGCSSVASMSVSQDNATPTATLISSGSLTCSVTSVTLTASPSGLSYAFSGPGIISRSGNTALVNASGTYSVTVVSSNGCSSVASVSVSQDNATPVASLISSGSLTCSVTSVTLTASPGGLNYTFSGPGVVSQNGNTALVNAAGTYSVTVVNGNGCSSVASTSVSQDNSAPTATLISSGSLTCAVSSVTLTASPGGLNYMFSGPGVVNQSGNTALVNASGTYSVTVLSANGCSSVASTSVSQDNATPVASLISSGSLTCAVSSVTLTASPAGLNYMFSGPGVVSRSGNTALVNASGTYSVTVLSANGCSSVASVSVSQDNATPVASLISSGSLTCAVSSVTLTASPAGLNYTFSGPGVVSRSGNTALVNASGTYSVTVVNANGCFSVASTSVSQDNSAPTATLISSGSLTCSVSSVTLTATPGGQNYTFSGPGVVSRSGNTALVNASGTYSVTVVNANGCFSVASTSISAEQTAPSLAINPSSTTLTCTSPTATLTATGTGSVRWNTGAITPAITVSTAGLYSVTLTSPGGCTTSASVNVSADQAGATLSLTNSALLTCVPGSTVTITAIGAPAGASFRFSPGATQVGVSNSANVSVAGTYSVTATAPNGCQATASTTVAGANCGFALTGVTTIRCETVDVARGERRVTFVPQYTGLSSEPVSFSIVNELPTTTAPGPYTLRLYTDNPAITLVAQQGSQTSTFRYEWLTGCDGSTPPVDPVNTPPVVVNPPLAQTATVGQFFSYSIPAGSFTDTQTPGQLMLSVAGLPAGLLFTAPATLSGTPSVSGTSQVTVTATDPGGLSVSTQFSLTVQPGAVVPPPSGFALTGVTTIRCETVDVARGERRVTFVPQYTGLSSEPVSFSIVNELPTTTAPGPYTLRLYTDNPAITLVAQQGSQTSTFRYEWLTGCSTSQGRLGVLPESRLTVSVLGNPLVGDELVVEVRGATGQDLRALVLDERGKPAAATQYHSDAQPVQRLVIQIPGPGGVYLLQVSTPTQTQTVKVIKAQ